MVQTPSSSLRPTTRCCAGSERTGRVKGATPVTTDWRRLHSPMHRYLLGGGTGALRKTSSPRPIISSGHHQCGGQLTAQQKPEIVGSRPGFPRSATSAWGDLGGQQPWMKPTTGRVRRRVGDVGAEELVEGLAVAFGKSLHPEQRTLVAVGVSLARSG